MPDPKKLVRGLKDLSPLFNVAPEEVPVRRSPEIQVIGVSSPDHDSDSLLLNTFFASQLASAQRACSLVSVLSRQAKVPQGAGSGTPESFGEYLERYCLYWDELRDLIHGTVPRPEGRLLQSRDIFLDFEYRHLLHCEKALGLLDKWVFLLKPTAESLAEGYKMMKVGIALNPQVEFFIALSGAAEGSKGKMIFEQFSDFTTQNLGVPLGWLGWMDLADTAKHFSADLHVESLRYQNWDAKLNLQKFMLAGWVESLEKVKGPHPLQEVLR
jgi:hypothetical protein